VHHHDAHAVSASSAMPRVASKLWLDWKHLKSAAGGLASVALPLLVTWIALSLHFNLAAAGFLQLFAVLVVALRSGFVQATVVSVIANGCLNYFFAPPFFSFGIGDPQNWVALLVFESSALLVSHLSAQAQKRSVRARTHQAESERLYEVSRQLLLLTRDGPLGRQVLALIQRVFSIEAAVLFDASEAAAEVIGTMTTDLEVQTKSAYLQDRDSQSDDGKTWIRTLRLGVRTVGALGLRAEGLTAANADALASLTAIALERGRSLARENRAEAERQTEQLRTVVLDALAHEYKTPLTVIRTAASGLVEMGQLSPIHSELLRLIDSEITRLSDLTTRLLQMSRLDKADLRVRRERIDLHELLETVIASTKKILAGHLVDLRAPEKDISIHADRELITMAVTQFLDNAAKYSDPASTITVSTAAVAGEVHIRVHNVGPPIAPDDRQRIFQRFYRSSESSHKAAGTGIGLSISKKVADAHQGRVWVTSEEGSGNTFVLALPRKAV